MIFAANPDVKNVGLLYSLSEANSTKPIADAKAYLDEKGISYTEQTANTNDEVITAASSLVADKVDAVFTPTDNVIMAAELAIFKDLADAGIPHYAGADSFVRNGAFATCGVNYTELGWDRKKATVLVGVIMVALGTLSSLGYGPLAGVTIIGMQFLDFFDFLTNSVMMPIAAIATCLLVSRVIGVDKIEQEVELDGLALPPQEDFPLYDPLALPGLCRRHSGKLGGQCVWNH